MLDRETLLTSVGTKSSTLAAL